jgi:hypothetical protein
MPNMIQAHGDYLYKENGAHILVKGGKLQTINMINDDDDDR